jgi:hypothetical protein
MELALTKGVKNSKKNAKIKKEGRAPMTKQGLLPLWFSFSFLSFTQQTFLMEF